MSSVIYKKLVHGEDNVVLQRELFQGIQENALVLPMKEKLNIVDKPDPDVKAVRPSLYAKQEKEAIGKTFMEIFNSDDD